MCGLYSNRKMAAEVKSIFEYSEEPPFAPRQYITPGGPMEIVSDNHGQRHFNIVRWGLVPGWAKEIRSGRPLINARAETILEKPSFNGAMKHRRCLIPADGYYEWQGDTPGKKQPYHITRPDEALFAFAGIWEQWMASDGSELDSAAIITIAANKTLRPIHHRMPVVITPENYGDWLDNDHISSKKAHEMLMPAPDDYFEYCETVIERGNKKPMSKSDQLSLF